MYDKNQDPDTLQDVKDIKRMMERSSRFISLSGLSGVSAGICGLAGAFFASKQISRFNWERSSEYREDSGKYIFRSAPDLLSNELVQIGLLTFIAALLFAFLFTYLNSKKTKVPVWGFVARKVMINVAVPMIVGAFVIYRLIGSGYFELISPCCLLFYGLALVNASKYTLNEIRYLGYCQLILGIVNLWQPHSAIYFWALGFGVMHIVYGAIMWWKYERKANP